MDDPDAAGFEEVSPAVSQLWRLAAEEKQNESLINLVRKHKKR